MFTCCEHAVTKDNADWHRKLYIPVRISTFEGGSMLTVTQSPSVVLLPNQAVAPQLPSKRDIRLEAGDLVVRLGLTEGGRSAAYRLRFLVFNLGMNEGLA